MMTFLCIIVAYVMGSIPFGLLLTKMAGRGDIRTIGSGNIGATNVLRTGNKPLALLTLLLDGGKGAIAVILAAFLCGDQWSMLLAAIFAIIGHVYPVWLKGKGGKGVATTIAAYYAIAWPMGIFASLVWVVTALTLRISSLSAIIAMLLTPIFAFYFVDGRTALATLFIGGLVIWRHQENILRILRGNEPLIGKP